MPGWSARYGFVGTGAITRAMVEGLSTVDDPPEIVVSPRGAATSAALAARFGNVRVAPGNQAVVDAAPCVVLAPRPGDASAVLDDLVLAPEHVVVSVVAGLSYDDLRAAAAPARGVARAIPLPSVAGRRGLVPVFPPEPEAVELFGRLGEVVALADDHATPGGLNEQVRTYVRAHGVHALVATALDGVAARVAGPRA